MEKKKETLTELKHMHIMSVGPIRMKPFFSCIFMLFFRKFNYNYAIRREKWKYPQLMYTR